MGLATSFANGGNGEYEENLRKICGMIVGKIDQGKVHGFVNGKCLVWMGRKNQELIRVCGYFLIRTVLEGKRNSNNQNNKAVP